MSSHPPAHGSGPSEEGEGDGHGSQEKGEKTAAGHGSEVPTIGLGVRASEGEVRPAPPELGLPRGTRRRISTKVRELMGPVSKKAKQEQPKSAKEKKLVRTKKKAQHKKVSAGKGSPPPPVRFPEFPKSGTARDVVKWSMICRKIGKKSAKDPRFDLPTLRNPKDPETTNAVQSPEVKKMIINVARFIVCVSSIGQDGVKIRQCSGIIIYKRESKMVIATSSIVVCQMGELLSPLPKLSICLADGDRTCLEGNLAFFNYHYNLVLLEIEVPFPVQLASIGTCPLYDQEVYALSRGKVSELMVRHGKMKYHGESDYLGRDYYMFLNCEIPEEGTGGCVVDIKGRTIGMSFRLSPNPTVLSITTIKLCIDMWLQFGRIARPLLGLSLRSISLLDVQLQDELSSCYSIDTGFIVDNVLGGSTAEQLGIEYGDVIHSFLIDDQHVEAPTLAQLEDYLLNIGQKFLKNPESTFELQVLLKLFTLLQSLACNDRKKMLDAHTGCTHAHDWIFCRIVLVDCGTLLVIAMCRCTRKKSSRPSVFVSAVT